MKKNYIYLTIFIGIIIIFVAINEKIKAKEKIKLDNEKYIKIKNEADSLQQVFNKKWENLVEKK